MPAKTDSRRGRSSGESSGIVGIDVDNLDEIKRAIRAAGPAARRALRKELKAVGALVQSEIRSRSPVYAGRYSRIAATSNRFGGTTGTKKHSAGLLRRSTKLRISTLSVTVYNDAKSISRGYPKGYRYGKRLEFDPKFGGRYAFFYPGYEARKEEAVRRFRSVLDAAAIAFTTGGP